VQQLQAFEKLRHSVEASGNWGSSPVMRRPRTAP
jgi:hypothetical protein